MIDKSLEKQIKELKNEIEALKRASTHGLLCQVCGSSNTSKGYLL